ncbi:2-amino-4-hydroxy-6-hydroxymethyldihydropteridine diphosphokinase [Actinocatenispora rupis]|uniref:2-amino-4-hydroxy-6-hydroxymethyldihydropteridine diphosphokinase n=1 Tax=Actinocatenispora rupis TaxID=519421 RepID=A0A8J3J6K0_9ACTN|nr:2-amino-4-hydroxy-6-hydroxymethyldihydropteridine diphosphokinase [Actinocatenispora rupis]GID15038.1 2-amino-4-hydroxy-6-hydroxymethyldihydropteridine pyrophosphokinase [Actinocatenispora rupis]
MSTAALSLGANLGDREGQLRAAVAGLSDVLVAVSGLYETPPWGDTEQPAYLNAVVLVADPAAGPRDWLRRAQALESAGGRVRDPDRRFGPRTLDVDVITVGTEDGPVTWDEEDLIVPHPRAASRAFVLVPLREVDPSAELAGTPVAELLAAPEVAADVPGVRRVAGAGWWER